VEVPGELLDQRRGHLQLLGAHLHLGGRSRELRLAHLVRPPQGLQDEDVAPHPQCTQPRLPAECELHDRGEVRLLESVPQQVVGLGGLRVRFEVVAGVEHDGFDLVARHELDHLDLAAPLRGQGLEVVVCQDHGALAVVVGLVDVRELDLLAAHLAAALVADAPAVGVVHLPQRYVVVLGGRVHLDGHVHQPERHRTSPDRPHAP